MRNVRNDRGFTLIELMIVVVIIGILAAIAIPRFTAVSQGAKQAEAGPILKQMCSLAEAENLRNSVWPATQAAISGWTDPASDYFDFTFAGTATTGTATATPARSGVTASLAVQTMNCVTGDLSDPNAAGAGAGGGGA